MRSSFYKDEGEYSKPAPGYSTAVRAEASRIVRASNQTVKDYRRDQCLHQLFEEQVKRTPDSAAVSFGKEQLTFSELNERANQLAHYLRDRSGGSAACVAICLHRSLELAIAIMGVLKSGAACVPLDPQYPGDRLQYMLHDVGARVVITDNALLPLSHDCVEDIVHPRCGEAWFPDQPCTNLDAHINPAQSAYIIYTSGSTGTPRGVLLHHRGLVNYNLAAASLYGLRTGDRVAQFCSISFDIAIEELFATWLGGATVVFRADEMSLAIPEFLSWVKQSEITVLDLPTAYWHEWVEELDDLREAFPGCLRLVIVGGEQPLPSAYKKWRRFVGWEVRWINSYGPTETSISATAYEASLSTASSDAEVLPIGRPLDNMQAYILDSNMNPVPVGVAGELYIGGEGVATGYLNRPKLTAEKFVSNPFSLSPADRLYRTGDIARYRASGDIEFIGRSDNQVKIRGFRVEPGEIEVVLSHHPAVRSAVVVARETASGEKQLVAYIVSKQTIGQEELRRFLSERLPSHMVPSAYISLAAMPITPNGKIDRHSLPEPEASNISARGVVPPVNKVQQEMVAIWEAILGVKPIGIRDNFFELGGHSLAAAKLMHRMGQLFSQTLPLAMLLNAPTIEQLAESISLSNRSTQWSSLVRMQPFGVRPPFFCVHGVGGNVVGFRQLAEHMRPYHPFYGFQAFGLDGNHASHERVEIMASHYISEMRAVQPTGPYLIGGYSFGGLVAYEMAQQLLSCGEKVALLALIDTHPQQLKPVGSSFFGMFSPSRAHMLPRIPRMATLAIQRRARSLLLSPVLKDVLRSCHEAADHYNILPYPHKAVFFRANEPSIRAIEDPDLGWTNLVGELEVHEIVGDHGGILVEPQVGALAAALKVCIDRVVPTLGDASPVQATVS